MNVKYQAGARLLSYGAVIAAGIFTLVAIGQSATVTSPPARADIHHESRQNCVSCHDDMDVGKVLSDSAGKCSSCHAADFITAPAAAAVQSAGDVKAAPAHNDELLPGMSVPMYYPQTRIGVEPNPMIRVPAGAFTMGSDNRLPDEGPAHLVDLKAFMIDQYEVTNLQYKQYIDATKHRSPSHFRNRTFPPGKADHPVTFVSWHDATDYCGWAGKRLPTDAEWEKAARGTDQRTFAWGNEFDINNANTSVRWERLGLEGDTAPVGAFAAGVSPYGVYDMSGNVWEWTASWYLAYPGNTRNTENYGEKYKTLKGGSWWDCSFYQCGISAPVFNRSFFNANVKNASFGFRCAKDITDETERSL
jgi:formylglycine-generating enzyme required for sulfatase activity